MSSSGVTRRSMRGPAETTMAWADGGACMYEGRGDGVKIGRNLALAICLLEGWEIILLSTLAFQYS